MILIKDRFPIVCSLAEKDGFICPAAKFDTCTIYTNDGVKARKRMGFCSYKSVCKPAPTKKKVIINPIKASKRRARTGSAEIKNV
jgi:hypothetical protein